MEYIPFKEKPLFLDDEEIERDKRVAAEWYDAMSPEKRKEAFVGLVVIHEHEVMGHIKGVINRSMELDRKIKENHLILEKLNDKKTKS